MFASMSCTPAAALTHTFRRRRMPLALALAIAALSVAGGGTAAAQAPPPASYQAEVVDVCRNTLGEPVNFRRGWWFAQNDRQGFGFDKIYYKHGIQNREIVCRAVRQPTKVEGPFPGSNGGGWAHERIFGEFDCRRGRPGCALVRSIVVRVIINYHGWSLQPDQQQGIVTAYCKYADKRPRCPAWINNRGVR